VKLRLVNLCLLGLAFLAFAGCVSASKARKDAQAAFISGQREAERRIQHAQELGPSVTVNGPVRRNSLPWKEGLSLSQAILEAGYIPVGQPATIFVVRAGIAYHIDLQTLLSGRDMPLQPGDIVQLNPVVGAPVK